MKLEGKVALVTGGGSGIGLAIARRFVQEGAHVFITGRREALLAEAVTLTGGRIEAIAGDLTSADDVARLFDTVQARAGRLDILVNSSGVAEPASLAGRCPRFHHRATRSAAGRSRHADWRPH
nr:SDR family oxidoreductase [Pantoea sp. B_10]